MKNLMKRSLLITLLCCTVIANAKSSEPSIMVNEIERKSIELTLNNFENEVKVYIKDTDGVILYEQDFENPSLSIKYNFKNLINGEYFLEIESDSKIKLIPFNVFYNSVELAENKEKIVYKPLFKKEKDLIFIYKLAINYEDMTIFIYDDELNLIYKEMLNGKQVLERKLNTSKLEVGNYKLVMKTEGLSFEHSIEI